jgi:hypothetical protein
MLDFSKLKTETYEYRVFCLNCSHMIHFSIPKGETVTEFLKKNKLCNICRCEHGALI